ncbi:lipopolysaccharide biosynthesis protein [Ruoffia sp. FAM 26255]|uniref:lipopolysaccharide biosynthesis protein n=1 Tax=Ruoffia sp. FAM 26255 TaxID=3259519 RepID=UPI00388939CD
MNSYKKLLNNSFVFAIGSLGSKIINIILVPIYTYYLSAQEYGSVDILITTVSMLLPIVSFSMYDAVLRFAMNKNSNKTIIFSNALFITTIGLILSLSFWPFFKYFGLEINHLPYFYLILFGQVFERLLAHYARGIGKVKVFALNGVILTFSTGILNIIFLVFLKLGIEGYLLSMVFAYTITISYLIYNIKPSNIIKIKVINSTTIKKLLKYSVPLIPNALMWWIINASSRYFILFYVGLSANGLFAVASRIPTFINLISQVFSQAWQLSAIEEYENQGNSDFYSKIFQNFISLMFISSSVIILIIKPLLYYVFAVEYYESWKVVPFLLLGVVFSSFSSFLGAIFIATKETKEVFKTSIYGGIVSLLLNYILIPIFGLIGAGIASMSSFFVMFLLRYVIVNKYIFIKIELKFLINYLILLSLQIIVLFINFSLLLEFVIQIIIVLYLIYYNRKLFLNLFKILLNKSTK